LWRAAVETDRDIFHHLDALEGYWLNKTRLSLEKLKGESTMTYLVKLCVSTTVDRVSDRGNCGFDSQRVLFASKPSSFACFRWCTTSNNIYVLVGGNN
jgi:hypothetical protein